MNDDGLDRDHWRRRLTELAGRFKVPGAMLGIAAGEQTAEIAFGVTNVDTGVEVTPDTLFQIGSFTKVWTATALLHLVDNGKLDLDQPVRTYLPELVLADADVAARVTTRHLLNHTSGIDGDLILDVGRGDDCLRSYVEGLADVPQNHPLGVSWSYCNSGFVVAGRLLERLTGEVWDVALRDLLYLPLGLAQTVTLPEDALLHRTAVGHVHKGDEPPRRAAVWSMPRAIGPAGQIASTVGDVLTFVLMHLRGGAAADGTRVLSSESAAAMQAKAAELPDPFSIAQSWGLGWFRLDWNGTELIGHDGNTIGQSAYVRVLPERDFVVTLLTNGGFTRDLYETLVREIFHELVGVDMARPLTPPKMPVDVDARAYTGTYERTGTRIEVFSGDGLRMRVTSTLHVDGRPDEPKEFDLTAVRDGLFVLRQPGAETWSPVTFYSLTDGTPYVHFGLRATPKVA